MRPAIGLAEPHPGRSRPIGAAFLVEELVYLALVGYDVGCGIGLWRTSLGGGMLGREAWAQVLNRR